jgi:hypothetical protein
MPEIAMSQRNQQAGCLIMNNKRECAKPGNQLMSILAGPDRGGHWTFDRWQFLGPVEGLR